MDIVLLLTRFYNALVYKLIILGNKKCLVIIHNTNYGISTYIKIVITFILKIAMPAVPSLNFVRADNIIYTVNMGCRYLVFSINRSCAPFIRLYITRIYFIYIDNLIKYGTRSW